MIPTYHYEYKTAFNLYNMNKKKNVSENKSIPTLWATVYFVENKLCFIFVNFWCPPPSFSVSESSSMRPGGGVSVAKPLCW